MKCEDVRAKLTGYLDGEYERSSEGSALRGHLRGCAACRQVATDEAALRDGLRALAPVDPPSSLWVGVQAKLAAAEVADAERPTWRRLVARWVLPQQLMFAGAGIAMLVGLLVWKSHRTDERVAPQVATRPAGPRPAPPPPLRIGDDSHPDVTAQLANGPADATAEYANAANELAKLAESSRASWTDAQKHTFDARVAELHVKIDHANEGRARQQAYRALIRYLQRAVVRDEVASV